ncbi:MAG: metallophosphoesterase [Roseovarius sp.]|nr:metallophosphoesterase [Roseovarius sp.]
MRGVTLAHISDVHLPLPARVDWRDVLNKRALSLLSWRRKRHLVHRPEVLARVVADMQAAAPDLIAVTGDLTNLGLPDEYRRARKWLEGLGDAGRVMVIPGNHDALVRGAWEAGAGAWRPFWQGDDGEGFPWLRRRGGLALIGVSSAVATPPARATGRVGAAQLARLGALLAGARAEGLCRVVMVHHPPLDGTVAARKRLLDGPALCDVLAREGAEMVLHGHSHRSHFQKLETQDGPAPVIGVPSASATHPEPAAWHRYEIAPETGGWRVTLTARRHTPEGMETSHTATHHLTRAHAAP